MKELMRFEKHQIWCEDEPDLIEGALISVEAITDIAWRKKKIIIWNGPRSCYELKNTPKIRNYLKEFGFYIDRETKE